MPPAGSQRPYTAAGENRRGPVALVLMALLALVLFAGFMALGTWQVHRRVWKLDLIARVDQRVHAPAVDAPLLAQWQGVTAAADEYRHVRLRGHFLGDRQTLVQANTEWGAGFWVMTPLRRVDGSIVLVNRGFVPQGWCTTEPRCPLAVTGETTVTGLLRMPVTWRLFRKNKPQEHRWYMRDVQQIAAARGLAPVAPYFVDEAASAGSVTSAPIGGLTVIHFPNNHLIYLITWYLLALMVAVATAYVVRDEIRLRRRVRNGQGQA